MRKIFLSLFTASLLVTSVHAQETKEKHKDKKDKADIEGSGNVITKEIPVRSFDELTALGIFSLELSQGDKEQLKIEADDNLMDLFIVENEDSKLKVHMKKDVSFSSKKKMKVYITFRNLKSLHVGTIGGTTANEPLNFSELTFTNMSVGSVDLNMSLKTLHLENQSVGNLTLAGKAENAVIRNNSVGNVQAGNFVVQTMDINNDGIGSATINAEKELKVRESFLGKVNNKGNATVKKKNRMVI